MRTNRERILELLRVSSQELDDDQLSSRLNIRPRQTVNVICRQLADEGLVVRRQGASGKITNRLVDRPLEAARPVPVSNRNGDFEPGQVPETPPGSSREQRDAEGVMLEIIGMQLGVALSPIRLSHPSGARVEIDGADEDRTVLVECWAHQGAARPAQKDKVRADALKLFWIAATLPTRPRLIICLSDAAAASGFMPPSRSWAAAAFIDLGIEVVVIELPADLRSRLEAAQIRQYR